MVGVVAGGATQEVLVVKSNPMARARTGVSSSLLMASRAMVDVRSTARLAAVVASNSTESPAAMIRNSDTEDLHTIVTTPVEAIADMGILEAMAGLLVMTHTAVDSRTAGVVATIKGVMEGAADTAALGMRSAAIRW